MKTTKIVPRNAALESVVWLEEPGQAAEIQEWTKRPDGSAGFLPRGEFSSWSMEPPSALLWVEYVKAWLPVRKGDHIVRELNGLGFFPLDQQRYATAYVPDGQDPTDGAHPCRFQVLVLNEQKGLAGIRCACHDRAYNTVVIGTAHQCPATGAWSPPEVYDNAKQGEIHGG